MKKIDKRTNFLGKQFVSSSRGEVLKYLFSQAVMPTKTQIVFTPNPEQLVYAKSHSEFDNVLGQADILLPDGIGIVYGAKLLSFFGKNSVNSQNLEKNEEKNKYETKYEKPHFVERITGVDVVSGLLGEFQKLGLARKSAQKSIKKVASAPANESAKNPTILIVGGRGYENLTYESWKVVSVCAQNIDIVTSKTKQHSLYWHEGFLNVTQQTTAEKKDLFTVIKKLQPEVVFVALGAPHQENWIIENKSLLESSGIRLAMAVGGTFDMLLGKVTRAPKWMQKIGLEWLFRLYQEPWRWRRQAKLMQFVKLVVQEGLK